MPASGMIRAHCGVGNAAGRTMIRKLHEIVDRHFAHAVESAPDQFACRPGCSDCCLVDLSVFPVEAALVRQAFAELPDATRKAAAERASLARHCCMLDPADGRCIVYHARPVICRSHGLTVLIDGNLDHCPKNYGDRPAARDCILDLEKLNTALVSVNMASGGDANRVRMADIALESK